MLHIENKEEVLSRFIPKYIINKETGCWEWTASSRGNEYGCIKIDGKAVDAHRVSYALFIDDIPDGMYVCHKCDNKRCVNPDHFFLGTGRDNTKDAIEKGRHYNIGNYMKGAHPEGKKGGDNYNAGTTNDIAKEIRKTFNLGCYSVNEISSMFNVSRFVVSGIIHNHTYLNV